MARHRKKTKKRTTPSLSEAERATIQAWLDELPETGPEQLASKVQDSRLAQALIEQLPPEEQYLPLLDALGENFSDKAVQKALRRSLFRFEQKGIQTGGFRSSEQAGQGILQAPYTEEPEAQVGPITDLSGLRAILVVMPTGATGKDVGMGLVSEEQGIQEFLSGSFSKKRIREFKAYISEHAGPLIETTTGHAASVLEGAYRQEGGAAAEAQQQYLRIRHRLLSTVQPLQHPPIYDFIEEVPLQSALTYSRLKELFGHPLLSQWQIPFDRLKPYLQDIVNIDQSPIVLTDPQKKDRKEEIKTKALEELFPDEKRALLRSRLEEMAYVFLRTDEPDTARLSLVAARTVDPQSRIGHNSVLEFLLERSLSLYLREPPEDEAGTETPPQQNGRKIVLPG